MATLARMSQNTFISFVEFNIPDRTVAANGTFPGPLISANIGDNLQVCRPLHPTRVQNTDMI